MPTSAIDRSSTALHRSGRVPVAVGDVRAQSASPPNTPGRRRRRRPRRPPRHRRPARPPTPHRPGCRRRSSPCRRWGPAPTSPRRGGGRRIGRAAAPPRRESASPGRNCANRSRSSRSVSVSTTVTGSVGVLLARTAASPSRAARRRRRPRRGGAGRTRPLRRPASRRPSRSCAGSLSGVAHRSIASQYRRAHATSRRQPATRLADALGCARRTAQPRRGDSMTSTDSTNARRTGRHRDAATPRIRRRRRRQRRQGRHRRPGHRRARSATGSSC